MKRLPLYRRLSTPSSFRAITSGRFYSSKTSIIDKNAVFIPLPKRNYFRIEGRDTFKFLQGIITNDIHQLQEQNDCLACAILNPKGRVVSDIFVYNTTAASPNGDEGAQQQSVLIETHAEQTQAVLQYLTMYKLRSKVKIIAKQGEYKTFFSPLSRQEVQLLVAGGASGGDGGSGDIVATDPRAEGFGTRVLFARLPEQDDSFAFPPRLLAGAGAGGGCSLGAPGLYLTHRLLWGLGEGSELQGRIPLEVNLDLTHCVSFTKGCYLGQELTARTKYKGVVRKRLVPVLLFDKSAVSGNDDSVTPLLSSVLGDGPNMPLFPEMSTADQQHLVQYLHSSQNSSVPFKAKQIVQPDKDGNDVVWTEADELNQWNKLRIFQTSSSSSFESTSDGDGEQESKTEERTIGKIVCVDNKYNQETFRLGLGLVTLSSLTSGSGSGTAASEHGQGSEKDARSGTRAFSVLNERFGWTVALQVLRPPWWPDVDPLTGNSVLPE